MPVPAEDTSTPPMVQEHHKADDGIVAAGRSKAPELKRSAISPISDSGSDSEQDTGTQAVVRVKHHDAHSVISLSSDSSESDAMKSHAVQPVPARSLILPCRQTRPSGSASIQVRTGTQKVRHGKHMLPTQMSQSW